MVADSEREMSAGQAYRDIWPARPDNFDTGGAAQLPHLNMGAAMGHGPAAHGGWHVPAKRLMGLLRAVVRGGAGSGSLDGRSTTTRP